MKSQQTTSSIRYRFKFNNISTNLVGAATRRNYDSPTVFVGIPGTRSTFPLAIRIKFTLGETSIAISICHIPSHVNEDVDGEEEEEEKGKGEEELLFPLNISGSVVTLVHPDGISHRTSTMKANSCIHGIGHGLIATQFVPDVRGRTPSL